jgi:peptidyl-prolyl cis-trans isomerase D
MLSMFRKKLTSWLMLGVLVVAVLAIVVTGFGTGGMGGLPSSGTTTGAETLVEVDGEEIKADELEQLLRRQLAVAQRENPEVDMDRYLAAGAFDGLLNQLVVGRALWVFGREQGLVVTDRMVDRMIAGISAFRNFAGQFDDATFRQVLAQQNLTEAQLRRELANVVMQQQLQLPIGLAGRAPESIAVQYASLMLERRRGSIGVVPTEALAQGIAPSDQEVAQYYARNRARYQIPERRVLRYALIGRDQLGDAGRATDAEIQAYYRDNAARYAGTETRSLQQVVLGDEAAARAFVGRAGGGTNFVQAAGQAGFSASDVALGPQTREQVASLINEQVAGQVFGAAQGGLIGPVRSPLGWHVIRIETINRANARPLEAVRAEIVAEIERRKIEDALHTRVSGIEERVDRGASFEEIARADRLQIVETPPITAAGATPGVQYHAPAELAQILRGAFQVDPEDPVPAFEEIARNERYAFVSVARVIPAAVPPLQQIAEQVRADVVRQRAWERSRALAERIAARISGGVPAARAFAEAGVRLPAPEPVNARRVDISQGRQAPQPLVMFFSVPRGRARAFPAPNGGGWYIVHVAERIPGQATCPPQQAGAQPSEGCSLIQSARAEFNGQAGGEYTEQFARAVQQGVEISRNEEAIAATRQRLQAGSIQVQ